ncbi:MAG: signal peptide peptidase SppA [Myxococcales bacterium]|jgi:protease-4|nr:signal peptide peptidase SppA [Myxococcales bacterium]
MKQSRRLGGAPPAGRNHTASSRPTLRALGRIALVGPLVWGAVTGFAASEASAQEPVSRPVQLPAPGRSVAGNGDSTAIVENPANLAFLPGAELRWSGFFLDDRALVPSQGHAFGLAFPLPFLPMATGIRYDFVNPTEAVSQHLFQRQANYHWLTWALALGSETASIGLSFQRSYSSSGALHGFRSWSASASARPSDYFGFAVVARNINGPHSDWGARIGPSYDLAGVIRPTGTDVLELGVESRFIDEEGGYWVPRGVLDVAIPQFGRLRGDFAMSDPWEDVRQRAWVASASLVLIGNPFDGSVELSGGTRFGNGLGSQAKGVPQHNIHTEIAFRSFRENWGTDARRMAVRVRMEDTPGARQHVALLRRLWSLADDEPSVRAVVLELRASPASSFAHVQELQDALYYLRQQDKLVLCHLEDASGAALYLCSAADRILINPAGGVRFAGLASRYFYFRDLLDKLGIRADFVRIGAHKSAPEQFVRRGSTDTARQDKKELLSEIEREMTYSIATGRDLSPAELRAAIAKGPFVSAEAKRAGLVDGYAFDDNLEFEVSRLAEEELMLVDDHRTPRREKRFGPQRHVALVYVDGDMVDGRSQSFPFVGVRTVGSYTIADSLRQARENPQIGAVVLRVETGGGSAMAADVIWREVQLTAARKPVVVSMGRAAASGGYYISAPATYVFANPLSITGSIGIFYGKVDVAELFRKIGVDAEVYKTAPRADAESLFRPYTAEEKAELKRKVQQFYGLFLHRVAEGRGMSKQEVDAVARGRVWTGRQAWERKLVDELGGLRQALAYARAAAGMGADTPIIELPVPQTSLVGRLLGVEGVQQNLDAQVLLPGELRDMLAALAPFAMYDGNQPLALAEMLPVGLP